MKQNFYVAVKPHGGAWDTWYLPQSADDIAQYLCGKDDTSYDYDEVLQSPYAALHEYLGNHYQQHAIFDAVAELDDAKAFAQSVDNNEWGLND